MITNVTFPKLLCWWEYRVFFAKIQFQTCHLARIRITNNLNAEFWVKMFLGALSVHESIMNKLIQHCSSSTKYFEFCIATIWRPLMHRRISTVQYLPFFKVNLCFKNTYEISLQDVKGPPDGDGKLSLLSTHRIAGSFLMVFSVFYTMFCSWINIERQYINIE